jgi:hypothetical protein
MNVGKGHVRYYHNYVGVAPPYTADILSRRCHHQLFATTASDSSFGMQHRAVLTGEWPNLPTLKMEGDQVFCSLYQIENLMTILSIDYIAAGLRICRHNKHALKNWRRRRGRADLGSKIGGWVGLASARATHHWCPLSSRFSLSVGTTRYLCCFTTV